MLDQVLQTLLSELQRISRTETVVGQPIRAGNATLVPISRVQIGFGVGMTGNGNGSTPPQKFSGSGTGGGLRIEPVACVVVDDNGRAQLLQLSEEGQGAFGKIIDLVPEVLSMLNTADRADSEKKAADKNIITENEPHERPNKRNNKNT